MTGATITGIGAVTPFGLGGADFWTDPTRMREFRITPHVQPGVPAPIRALAAIPLRLEVERELDRRALRKVSDHTRLVTLATHLCLEDAKLVDREELGMCVGTSFGSSIYHLEYHQAIRRQGITAASALLFTQSVFNAATGHAGQVFGMRGGNLTFVGGEAVGLEAILRAAVRIRTGSDSAMIAGGAEQYSDLVHASLYASELVGNEHDPMRRHFVEGVVVMSLEGRERAEQRGARRLADIVAVGSSRGHDVETAVATACENAEIELGELDLAVCAPPAQIDPNAFLRGIGGGTGIALLPEEFGTGFGFGSALAVAAGVRVLQEGPFAPLAIIRPPRASRRAGLVLVVAGTRHGQTSALVLADPR